MLKHGNAIFSIPISIFCSSYIILIISKIMSMGDFMKFFFGRGMNPRSMYKNKIYTVKLNCCEMILRGRSKIQDFFFL